jgi:HSP20 family molecular chaperone IbpA
MSSISSQYSNRTELADQYKAQQAEKEELENNHSAEVDNLKKSYTAEKANLEDHFESSLQSEKSAHYDHLRNLKQQMNREERNLQSTRDHLINQKQDTLRHEETQVEQDGRARVTQAIQKYAAAEEFERNRALKAQEQLQTDHRNNAEHIINDSQKRLNQLAEEKTNYLEEQKQAHAEALGQIGDHYQAARLQTQKQYASEADAISARANQDLNERRLASTSLIQNFDAKHDDPFYQIKRFESDLLETGDAFVLRVKVPDYERGQFRVQVSNQEIRLLGVRQSDEKVELEPGRSVATRSYQNIAEHYALSAPIDGRAMTYKEDGDWLEYTIPKFGPGHRVDESYRKPMAFSDAAVTKELNFKNTLPTPQSKLS